MLYSLPSEQLGAVTSSLTLARVPKTVRYHDDTPDHMLCPDYRGYRREFYPVSVKSGSVREWEYVLKNATKINDTTAEEQVNMESVRRE